MVGWFIKKSIPLADFQGLKMRMPGLGGEVLKKKWGASLSIYRVANLHALQRQRLMRPEWVGPYTT